MKTLSFIICINNNKKFFICQEFYLIFSFLYQVSTKRHMPRLFPAGRRRLTLNIPPAGDFHRGTENFLLKKRGFYGSIIVSIIK